MCAAGALRGSPASITATRRRARPSTNAALSPAGAASDHDDVPVVVGYPYLSPFAASG